MQKKIIALAVAAVASGAAFAQTNVTISGNLNYQWENISGSSPTMSTAGVANNQPQMNREGRNRVNENGSEIKFSVTEDLGNGLKAMAVIASGLSPDAAASTPNGSRGALGSRDSYVGLSGNFGTVVAGRLSVHYNSGDRVDDFFLNTGLAGSTRGILSGVGSMTTATGGYGAGAGGRLGSAVAYVTPTFSGFSGTIGYARPNVATTSYAGDGSVVDNDGSATNGNAKVRKQSGWTIKGDFNNGPITAFLSYLAHSNIAPSANVLWQNSANTSLLAMNDCAIVGGCTVGAVGTTTTRTTSTAVYSGEIRGFRAGGAYTFGNGLKIGLIYDNTKNLWRDDSGNTNANDDDLNIKRTVWAVPVSMKFGNHVIGGTYARAGNIDAHGSLSTAANNRNVLVDTMSTSDTGATYWMLGYQYNFSKRTNVSAMYARTDNDQRASYDFYTNASMGHTAVATTTTGVNNNTRGSDPTTVQIGIKHAF
jgi:predicted porin